MKQKLFFYILLLSVLSTSKVAAQTDAFIGELRLFPYGFTPRNWASCEGQLLSIAQNSALFGILGTYYGGNGTNNFALPDLRGRAIISFNPSFFDLGAIGGTTTNTLLVSQLPAHTHTLNITAMPCNSASGTSAKPGYYAVNPARGNEYSTVTNSTSASTNLKISPIGLNTPVYNMQPYLVLRWCICMSGVFPSRPY
ncbi:MAG: tail fiber protein [Bacteroidota bacterium]|nr:tail fiber protein [Bacteroidota bacterium]